MKFSLIVAVVVLALAQGSFGQSASDLESLTQYFEEMKAKVAQELTELLRRQDLESHAQSFQEQLGPLATQFQERLSSIAAGFEEQVKPMAASVQAQIQPMVEKYQKQAEALLQSMAEQARAIGQ